MKGVVGVEGMEFVAEVGFAAGSVEGFPQIAGAEELVVAEAETIPGRGFDHPKRAVPEPQTGTAADVRRPEGELDAFDGGSKCKHKRG